MWSAAIRTKTEKLRIEFSCLFVCLASLWVHNRRRTSEQFFFCIAALFLFSVCWYSMYKLMCEDRVNWLGNYLFSKQVRRVIRIRAVQMKCRWHAAMTRTRLSVTLYICTRLLRVKKVSHELRPPVGPLPNIRMSVEHWWNGSYRRELGNLGTVSFVHRESMGLWLGFRVEWESLEKYWRSTWHCICGDYRLQKLSIAQPQLSSVVLRVSWIFPNHLVSLPRACVLMT
jgi:hypothetical protein